MFLFYTLLSTCLQARNTLVIPDVCHTEKLTGIECCNQIAVNCSSSGRTHCNVVDSGGGTVVSLLLLENCGYVGNLPDFSPMFSLKELYLSGNLFSTLDNLSTLEGLDALTLLDLSNMNSTLHGQELPNTGNFPFWITHLDMSGNGFTGKIPTTLLKSNLMYLILSNNQLTGPLPPELSTAYTLKYLDLSNNTLGGTLVNLKDIINLENIYLENCGLTGNINIAGLTKLERARVIHLDNNELEGSLPAFGELNSMAHLELISLHGNKLTGSIPTSYANLQSLIYLDLSHNMLTGGVPTNFGDSLPELVTLDLSHNQLTGTIPSNLGGDSSPLMYLDLSNNLLSGSVPKLLYSMEYLYYLDISNNSLTGGLPEVDDTDQFQKIQHFSVSNNLIGGEIPTTFGQLSTTLGYLDLSLNHFSGAIPSSFLSFHSTPGGATLNLGNNLALTCPVTNYSAYASNTDWGTYGTRGLENCGHSYASPHPTMSPNHSSGPKPMGAGFIILIIIGVFSVITGIIYWRWNAGKIQSSLHERLDDDGLMDAVSYEDYNDQPVTDYKTAGTVGQESILARATRRNEFT